jgi:hypothetical protein
MNPAFPNRIRPVWLASYPRSGNTFLRIILQNLFGLATYSAYRTEGADFPDPSADALERAPFLPGDWRHRLTDDPAAEQVLIKTHNHHEPGGRTIYIVRDGYAAIDSYFNYHKKFSFEQPSLTEVVAGACQFGGWSEHYLSWQPQSRPQTWLLRYELLVNHPQDCVQLLADFLQIMPRTGRLPTFAELKDRSPEFFRRGQDSSFLEQWTPAQRCLFNELHGSVMTQLGYALQPGSESAGSAAVELARSAASSHRLYLDQLSSVGTHAAALRHVREKLAQADAARERLAASEARLSTQLEQSQAALSRLHRNVWVKVGAALGMIRTRHRPDQKPERQSSGLPGETRSGREPLPNLR